MTARIVDHSDVDNDDDDNNDDVFALGVSDPFTILVPPPAPVRIKRRRRHRQKVARVEQLHELSFEPLLDGKEPSALCALRLEAFKAVSRSLDDAETSARTAAQEWALERITEYLMRSSTYEIGDSNQIVSVLLHSTGDASDKQAGCTALATRLAACHPLVLHAASLRNLRTAAVAVVSHFTVPSNGSVAAPLFSEDLASIAQYFLQSPDFSAADPKTCSAQFTKRPKLPFCLLLLPDFDAVDATVVANLALAIPDGVRVALVLTSASGAAGARRRLPAHTYTRMRFACFELSEPRALLSAFYERAMRFEIGLCSGPRVIGWLFRRYTEGTPSLALLVAALRYRALRHLSESPLSVLAVHSVRRAAIAQSTSDWLDLVRSVPSVSRHLQKIAGIVDDTGAAQKRTVELLGHSTPGNFRALLNTLLDDLEAAERRSAVALELFQQLFGRRRGPTTHGSESWTKPELHVLALCDRSFRETKEAMVPFEHILASPASNTQAGIVELLKTLDLFAGAMASDPVLFAKDSVEIQHDINHIRRRANMNSARTLEDPALKRARMGPRVSPVLGGSRTDLQKRTLLLAQAELDLHAHPEKSDADQQTDALVEKKLHKWRTKLFDWLEAPSKLPGHEIHYCTGSVVKDDDDSIIVNDINNNNDINNDDSINDNDDDGEKNGSDNINGDFLGADRGCGEIGILQGAFSLNLRRCLAFALSHPECVLPENRSGTVPDVAVVYDLFCGKGDKLDITWAFGEFLQHSLDPMCAEEKKREYYRSRFNSAVADLEFMGLLKFSKARPTMLEKLRVDIL